MTWSFLAVKFLLINFYVFSKLVFYLFLLFVGWATLFGAFVHSHERIKCSFTFD